MGNTIGVRTTPIESFGAKNRPGTSLNGGKNSVTPPSIPARVEANNLLSARNQNMTQRGTPASNLSYNRVMPIVTHSNGTVTGEGSNANAVNGVAIAHVTENVTRSGGLQNPSISNPRVSSVVAIEEVVSRMEV